MAQITQNTIPREFEVTRQFEATEGDEIALKSLREKLFSSDVASDVRDALGRSMDQLRMNFLRVAWGRFGQFVQRVPLAFAGLSTGAKQSTQTLTKSEVTTKYETSGEEVS